MPAPKQTRRDRAFSEAAILACMPGTKADITRKSGFSQASVGRIVTRLEKAGKVHQGGWHQAFRWWAVWHAGPVPEGFVLAAHPDQHKMVRDRVNRYKRKRRATDPEWRAKEAARRVLNKIKQADRDPAWILKEKERKHEAYLRSKALKAKRSTLPQPITAWVGGSPFKTEKETQ